MKQFEAIKASSEATSKELELYKKKEIMRANGIENQRFMDLALFELRESKNFEADVKTWAENNKNLLTPPTTEPPKGKTLPPLGGNPNNNDNPADDPFTKGLLKGAGMTEKDLK